MDMGILLVILVVSWGVFIWSRYTIVVREIRLQAALKKSPASFIGRAKEFYQERTEHVQALIVECESERGSTYLGVPPSSDDVNYPVRWCGDHWKWFFRVVWFDCAPFPEVGDR